MTIYKDELGRRYYAMNDVDPKSSGLIEISDPSQMYEYNEKKYGIFWTVNKIKDGLPRRKENIEKIMSIAFEIDKGSKEVQIQALKKGLEPSLIIETKRGHHVYFFVDDFEPDADYYRDFLLDRIIPFYNADHKAADATRILRVPTFMHWKDIDDPFLIKTINLNTDLIYCKKVLMRRYPIINEREKNLRDDFSKELKFQKDNDLFMRIWSSNQATLLKKLSGTEAVGMERIDFRRTQGGNYNIIINGKSTSCWIDSNGKIGSSDRGGPTVWQWVNWYHKDHKTTYNLIKKYLPEVIGEL